MGVSYGRHVDGWGVGGRWPRVLTLASCLVMKSTKPKPRWDPVPLAFLGKRTVFSSPNVLARGDVHIRASLKQACATFNSFTQSEKSYSVKLGAEVHD